MKSNQRRNFIKKSALLSAGLGLAPQLLSADSRNQKDVVAIPKYSNGSAMKNIALIANIYRNSAHADVIGTKLFAGIPADEGMVDPTIKIASLWIDQIGENDTGVRIAEMNGTPMNR